MPGILRDHHKNPVKGLNGISLTNRPNTLAPVLVESGIIDGIAFNKAWLRAGLLYLNAGLHAYTFVYASLFFARSPCLTGPKRAI
jgi:hypothetical protein